MHADTLKACPFCGDSECPCSNYGYREEGRRFFVSFCVGQTDDFTTMEDAIAAWNRRAAGEEVAWMATLDGKPNALYFTRAEAEAAWSGDPPWKDDPERWSLEALSLRSPKPNTSPPEEGR